MSVQTTYSTSPAGGFAGQLVDIDEGIQVVSRTLLVAAAVSAGIFVMKTGLHGCRPPATTDAVASTVNAIVTTHASSASILTLSGAGLNGTIGAGTMTPPRHVTIVLNSNANWDATNVVVTGVDERGETISETLAIPDTGGATLTTVAFFKSVTSIVFDAQSGTGGSFTVGISDPLGSIETMDPGFALYDASKQVGQYLINDPVPTLHKGRLWLNAENAVNRGDPVYVRFVSDGGSNTTLGTARDGADANRCVRLKGARWAYDTTAAGMAMAELNFPT